MNPIYYVLSSIFFNTASHLFLKNGVVGANLYQKKNPNSGMKAYLLQPSIWGGLFLNGLAAFFWLLGLSAVELSYAFPFLSLNYILIPIGALLLYKENLTKTRIIGISVICIGIFLIAMS